MFVLTLSSIVGTLGLKSVFNWTWAGLEQKQHKMKRKTIKKQPDAKRKKIEPQPYLEDLANNQGLSDIGRNV